MSDFIRKCIDLAMNASDNHYIINENNQIN